jgi:hypothetical protein
MRWVEAENPTAANEVIIAPPWKSVVGGCDVRDDFRRHAMSVHPKDQFHDGDTERLKFLVDLKA